MIRKLKIQITSLLMKLYTSYLVLVHIIGKISGKYYFEDYLRVYPDEITYHPLGIKRKASNPVINNFLNHKKFYLFASQFVKGKIVADVGCGSGYGVEIFKKFRAKRIFGSDISKHSINFAREKYGKIAEFSIQGITDLNQYSDNFFDVTTCAEVLEHIAEYGMEGKALSELKRITKKNGVVIVSTPNNEIVEDHGFSFKQIVSLFDKYFDNYCIFENALLPVGKRKNLWLGRLKEGKVGIVISELLDESEVAILHGIKPEFKTGLKAGRYKFNKLNIDTRLLHNTHSWIIIAKKI